MNSFTKIKIVERGKANFPTLSHEIISRSVADDWEEAKEEWKLEEIQFAEEAKTCLCSHYPIKELCILRNRLNGQQATVGNVCVNRFLGIGSELIFQGFKRIAEDHQKALNEAASKYAYEHEWISKWEYEFCNGTARKRSLTEKQMMTRVKINQKVEARIRDLKGAK